MEITATKNEARANRQNLYRSAEPCSICEISRVRYTKNDRCKRCQREKIYILSQLIRRPDPVREPALGAYLLGSNDDGSPLYARTDWVEELLPYRDAAREHGYTLALHPCGRCGSPRLHHTGDRGCWACRNEANSQSPRQQALAAGHTWYTPDTPCLGCGYRALKNVHNGRCQGCHPLTTSSEPSARQQALAAGHTWYTPDTPCKRCQQRALRRVHDGRCQGCHPPADQDGKPDMSTVSPDAVISRGEARALGLLTYRTGDYCRKGHNGWRYVSTGQCVDCMRR